MDAKETRQAKTEKPHDHFDDPQQVVADPALSKQDKLEALETLEQDARLLATATEEGMTGGEQSSLRDVLSAKKALENANDATSNPPPQRRKIGGGHWLIGRDSLSEPDDLLR